MDDNIFNQGTLVNLSVSVWGIRKKLPSEALHLQADPEFIRAAKFLVDKEQLKPIEQARNFARGYLKVHSLPFPVKGIVFIPKHMVNRVDEELRHYQAEFYANKEAFINNYHEMKSVAQTKLKDLFNENDYPSNIESYFSFSWVFMNMKSPDEFSIIDPEILQREQQRYLQMIAEFKDNAVSVLRERFSEMVSRIVDRLTGEEKIFKNSTIENIKEFLGSFEALNINNDVELEAQVKKVEAILSGADPKDLRTDEFFRLEIGQKMTEVKEALDGMMTNRPKRALYMEEA